MSKTYGYTQEYDDREYEAALDERIEALYAQAYENQRRREDQLWEERRKSGSNPPQS